MQALSPRMINVLKIAEAVSALSAYIKENGHSRCLRNVLRGPFNNLQVVFSPVMHLE